MHSTGKLAGAVLVTAVLTTMIVGTPAVASEAAAGAGGSGRSGDFTGDAYPDILAREKGTGKLRVYPFSVGNGNPDTYTYTAPVTINAGWNGMRWIGAADLTGDGYADVLAIDSADRMVVARNSGTFDGLNTLVDGTSVVGFNWWVNDLVFTYDYDRDGLDDVLGRNVQTGNTVVYLNNGSGIGTSMFDPPRVIATGRQQDTFQGLGYITDNVYPDLIYTRANGVLGVYNLHSGDSYVIGHGWDGIDTLSLTRLDFQSAPDIVGRDKHNGNLRAYLRHVQFSPWAPLETYHAPRVIGYNWHVNDIIV